MAFTEPECSQSPFIFGPATVHIETTWHNADSAMLDEEVDEVIPMMEIGTGEVHIQPNG